MAGRLVRMSGRLFREERGLSLTELLVAMFVFGIVMLIFTSTMASVQRAVVHQDNLSRSNDQARLALQQLDREVRSGNVLYDPATESDPGYLVRVYTQANAPTRGSFTCVLWKVDTSGNLSKRYWPPNDPGSASNWHVEATGIVNKQLGVPAFALDSDPLKGGRTLRVNLRVNEDLEDQPGSTFELSQALTGRNTSFGYPVSVCATTPT